MSMLSAQCDKLRQMAESVGLAMPQAATLMMEAADTIWELRDDLQQANDAVQDAEHDESMAWDRVRKAEADNVKLRELAQHADRLLTGLFPYIDYSRCTALEAVAAWRVRARELGVEVDA